MAKTETHIPAVIDTAEALEAKNGCDEKKHRNFSPPIHRSR